MTVFQAFLSGILQGATEFLPISSSGHLVIFHDIIRVEQSQLLFDVFLHAGTLIAIIVFFRGRIAELFFRRKKLGALILLGTVPAGVLGLIFSYRLEERFAELFSKSSFSAGMLIVTGLWLFSGEYAMRKAGKKTAADGGTIMAAMIRALTVGAAQAVALFPGISRSGSTISTAMIMGVDKEESVRFSFYLAVPATAGAIAVSLLKACSGKGSALAAGGVSPACFFVGMAAAALVGMAAIKILLIVLRKQKFYLFGIYCVLVGTAVLMFR